MLSSRLFRAGERVLDVASGTGIFTRALREADPVGLRIAGLEPGDAMRATAVRSSPLDLEFLAGS
ncbi:MAG: hypothetical protein AB1758_38385, partial [Candidatus Eremiobacterota bacterium]